MITANIQEIPDRHPAIQPVPLFYVMVTLQWSNHAVQTLALLDHGSTNNFLSSQIANEFQVPRTAIPNPVALRFADGTVSSSTVEHISETLILSVQNHTETVQLAIADIRHPIILGMPWFRQHNPFVNYKTERLLFKSCPSACSGKFSPVPLLLCDNHECQLDTRSMAFDLCTTTAEMCLPVEYEDYLDVFEDSKEHSLPPLRAYDLDIVLKDSTPPPLKPLYNLSLPETEILREWINDQLDRGLIRPSKSPTGAPVFFVKKKDGGLRPCVDYRELNARTVKDRYPLPLISQLLDTLSGANYFTAIDLKGAYNLVRIKPGCEWLAAFRTKFGLFEPLVIPFGLTNAPAVFQRFINDVFSDLLDTFVVVYLDDILVFSPDLQTHIEHVRAVLQRLRDHRLVAKLSKCIFNSTSVSFLGYIVSRQGVSMCPKKVEAISGWPTPTSVTDIQRFLGLTNFYRKFVAGYSRLISPMTDLTKKDTPFVWSDACKQAFQQLKDALSRDVILPHPDLDKPFVLETDASDAALGAVLYQLDSDGRLRPLAFHSRKFLPAERNYTVHDRELLAIVDSLRHWRHYLMGSTHTVQIISDHRNLTFFRTAQLLKPRHARWAELLSEYDFSLSYRPGSQNPVADALSRHPTALEEGDGAAKRMLTLLPSNRWHKQTVNESDITNVNISNETNEDSNHDEDDEMQGSEWPEMIAFFLKNDRWPNYCPNKKFLEEKLHMFRMEQDELYRLEGLERVLYLPTAKRQEQMRRFHDGLAHLASASILPLLKRRFWWPNMVKDMKKYVSECPQCQLDRPEHFTVKEMKRLPMRPIPSVALPFERWGLDFIQNLPRTKKGNRHIITAIDYGTRWVLAKAVPEMTTEQVVSFLYDEVLMHYGAPYELITDRGSSFMAEAMTEFERLQGIRHLASSPYHPQTNGMVERMHSMMGHAITTLSNAEPNRWDEFLAQTLFALRVRTHAVTKASPFYLLYGVEPRLPGDTGPPRCIMEPLDEIEAKEARSEFTARTLDELGQVRAAAYHRTLAQAEKMKKNVVVDPDAPTHYFQIGDWVKMKHHSKLKFEFKWKGPYVVVKLGHPGTYRLMEPGGRWLDAAVNQRDLAPWLARTIDDQDYFYDGTSRALEGE